MAHRTIEVGHWDSGPKYEAIASGTITPGMLVEMTNATADTMKAHATSAGWAEAAFAVEDNMQGNEIGDNYASGAQMQYRVFRAGDMVYALLKDGQTAAKGDALISNGDGTLAVSAGDSEAMQTDEHIVGMALEGVAASGADARILIRVC
jgi:hypothetical protein